MNYRIKALYLLFLKEGPLTYCTPGNDLAVSCINNAFDKIAKGDNGGNPTTNVRWASSVDIAKEIVYIMEEA